MKRINYFFTHSLLLAVMIIGSIGCQKKETPLLPDPEGTVIVFMRNGNDGADQTSITPKNCTSPFFINGSDNFEGENWKFAILNEMEGLAYITEIPVNADWTNQVAVKPKYGYVGECINNDSTPTYVRMYVSNLIKNSATGGIIGAEVRYQSPFLPKDKE